MTERVNRIEGALLAGVCARIAQTFHWNVWVLRALFVAFLLLKTLWAAALYAIVALGMHLLGGQGSVRPGLGENLESPELSRRGERIADLERRFRELETRNDQER